jgi:hypothetical protein
MATIGQSNRTRCRDKLSLLMPPLPGRNRGHVLPLPGTLGPRCNLCLRIGSAYTGPSGGAYTGPGGGAYSGTGGGAYTGPSQNPYRSNSPPK